MLNKLQEISQKKLSEWCLKATVWCSPRNMQGKAFLVGVSVFSLKQAQNR